MADNEEVKWIKLLDWSFRQGENTNFLVPHRYLPIVSSQRRNEVDLVSQKGRKRTIWVLQKTFAGLYFWAEISFVSISPCRETICCCTLTQVHLLDETDWIWCNFPAQQVDRPPLIGVRNFRHHFECVGIADSSRIWLRSQSWFRFLSSSDRFRWSGCQRSNTHCKRINVFHLYRRIKRWVWFTDSPSPNWIG